jgi:hypothetical protein
VSGRAASIVFALVAAFAASSAAFAADAAPAAAASSPAPSAPAAKKEAGSPPADLNEARARLAAASSPAEYAAMLDSFSDALSPVDALALLDRGIEGAPQEARKPLLVKAAGIDLLLGLFGEAAARYEAAAKLQSRDEDVGLLLRAARCLIAAGEAEKAQSIASGLLMMTIDPDSIACARLVGAWALVMADRPEDASTLASTIAGAQKGSPSYPSAERRREARFILWLCAKGQAKAPAAAALAAEFPGSAEALIASGSASAPPLPHWYLGGLGAARSSSPSGAAAPAGGAAQGSASPGASPAGAVAASAAKGGTAPAAPSGSADPAAAGGADAPVPALAGSSPAAAAKGKRLQVGYFSREDNAQALKSELASKGFAAATEPRLRAAAGKADERRWIVVVDPGKDLAATLQKLKDAGYESYVID